MEACSPGRAVFKAVLFTLVGAGPRVPRVSGDREARGRRLRSEGSAKMEGPSLSAQRPCSALPWECRPGFPAPQGVLARDLVCGAFGNKGWVSGLMGALRCCC